MEEYVGGEGERGKEGEVDALMREELRKEEEEE